MRLAYRGRQAGKRHPDSAYGLSGYADTATSEGAYLAIGGSFVVRPEASVARMAGRHAATEFVGVVQREEHAEVSSYIQQLHERRQHLVAPFLFFRPPLVIPGWCVSTRPGISRFLVRLFDAPRK